MTRPRRHGPWSDKLPGRQPEADFHWRGHEVSRLEGFSDTVFAFAVTLLIVALEVPHDFAGMEFVVRGFPAFVVCFLILMAFWNAHYRYFRRYGLEDTFTHVINYAILLMVLFASYPLKFLFTGLFEGLMGTHHEGAATTMAQWSFVYRAYGAGFGVTWGLYALLFWHAYRLRGPLRLNPVETLRTRAALGSCLVYVAVCLLSIALTFFPVHGSVPGMVYFLIGAGMFVNYGWHGRRIRALKVAGDPEERHEPGT